MNPFKIAQPQSLSQASALLSKVPSNTFLMAGGTDILDEVKNEIISPEVVVDLSTVPDLATIRQDKDGVRIGAMTKVKSLAEAPLIQDSYPGLVEAALSLATPQLRNMGTVGGNLCQRPRCWYYRDPLVICRKKGGTRCFAYRGRNKYHAIFGGGTCYIVYPSDLAPMLISLDAEAVISSPKKEKTVPLAEFYILPQVNIRKENILAPNEILKEIRIPPKKQGQKSTYFKLKERGTWDFAVVSAAVTGTVSAGIFKDIRIVLGGVAPIPWQLSAAERMIKGNTVTETLLRQALKEALKEARPLEENAYKVDLVEAAVMKTVMSFLS